VKIYAKVCKGYFDLVLQYYVHYEDGCTVMFPYTEYGKRDCQRFIDLKVGWGECIE
jgi:hypothetical protein